MTPAAFVFVLAAIAAWLLFLVVLTAVIETIGAARVAAWLRLDIEDDE